MIKTRVTSMMLSAVMLTGLFGGSQTQKIIEREALCSTKSDYAYVIEKYKDYLSDDIVDEFRRRYSNAPVKADESKREIVLKSKGSNKYVYLVHDTDGMYYLTTVREKNSKIETYETKTLYEV